MVFIRAAEPADGGALQALFEETMAAAQWLPPASRSNVDFEKASIGEAVYVCTGREGEVLALVSVYESESESESFIHHLYVAARCQGQGLGSALLDALEAWVPLPWRLKCIEANTRALAFYRARGWVETGRARGADGPYLLLEKADGTEDCAG